MISRELKRQKGIDIKKIKKAKREGYQEKRKRRKRNDFKKIKKAKRE